MDEKIAKLQYNIDKIDELILQVFQLSLQNRQRALLMKVVKHLDEIEKIFGLYEEIPQENKEVMRELAKALLAIPIKNDAS